MSSFSPALAHRQRVLAALAAGATSGEPGAPAMPTEGPAASEYEQLLMALGEDLRRLSNIQSIDNKIAAKREMIGKFMPWVEGALEGQPGTQDDVVATMLVWALDLADWDLAQRILSYMIGAKISLPVLQGYKRSPGAFAAEQSALAGLLDEPTIDLEALQRFSALTADVDMHDQIRAKLLKAIGTALHARADAFDPTAESAVAGGKRALVESALAHFKAALAKDANVGVKKTITALESALKKLVAEGT